MITNSSISESVSLFLGYLTLQNLKKEKKKKKKEEVEVGERYFYGWGRGDSLKLPEP
jgi:hypothetical protein